MSDASYGDVGIENDDAQNYGKTGSKYAVETLKRGGIPTEHLLKYPHQVGRQYRRTI